MRLSAHQFTSTQHRMNLFSTVNFPTSYGLGLSGNLPSITVALLRAQSGDPSNYSWQAAMPHDEDNRGKMNSVARSDLQGWPMASSSR
jgi:hypothetical protein